MGGHASIISFSSSSSGSGSIIIQSTTTSSSSSSSALSTSSISSSTSSLKAHSSKVKYDLKPLQVWKLPTDSLPMGIISDGQLLYLCDNSSKFSCLRVYNLEGQIVERKSPLLFFPSDIDLYQNCLYIIDKNNVSIFNLQFQLLSSFPIPSTQIFAWNHLKVDDNFIYVTIYSQHQVFIYTRDGKIKNTIGSTSESSKVGEFNKPFGLTLDKNTLYICDYLNHRIQTFSKDDYSFCKQWGSRGRDNGQFIFPYSISYWEGILYVGDDCSVQLFTFEGTFLQRIGGKKEGKDAGQFDRAWGICVVGDRLYVSDYVNERVQVFK